MKLIYNDNGTIYELGSVVSNHFITIDYMLELLEIDMDVFAEKNGWDGWDYDALEIVLDD